MQPRRTTGWSLSLPPCFARLDTRFAHNNGSRPRRPTARGRGGPQLPTRPSGQPEPGLRPLHHPSSDVLGAVAIPSRTGTHRFGSSCHAQLNGLLSHPQDLDAPLRLAAQRKLNDCRQQYADNQNISFLPDILSTSTRMHGEFLRLLLLQAPPGDRGAHHCHWRAITTQPIGLVPFQARGILPVAEEQSRTRGGKAAAIRINLYVEGCGIVSS